MKRERIRRGGPKGIAWEAIAELLTKGYEPRDIAYRLGCSVQNVYDRIARHEQQASKNGTKR